MNGLVKVFVMLVLTLAACKNEQRSTQGDATAALDRLEHRTAWILLGELDSANGWATQIHFVHPAAKELDRVTLPKSGDLIEVTDDMMLAIVGYKTSGETHRLQSPAGRVLTVDDSTGAFVHPPARLRIEEIEIEQPVGGLRGVWVRVVPAGL